MSHYPWTKDGGQVTFDASTRNTTKFVAKDEGETGAPRLTCSMNCFFPEPRSMATMPACPPFPSGTVLMSWTSTGVSDPELSRIANSGLQTTVPLGCNAFRMD